MRGEACPDFCPEVALALAVDCINSVSRIDSSRGVGPLGSTGPDPSEVGTHFRYLSH